MVRKKIFSVSGSTRAHSVNLQLLLALGELYKDKVELEIFNELDQLPHFNPDLDNDEPPKVIAAFREKIQQADGVLICTPEYVFSLPGSLKNALEWMVSTIILTDKPAALITASSSGVKGHEALQLVMSTIGARLSTDTSLLIQAPKTKISNTGEITDKATLEQLTRLMDVFIAGL